MLPLWYLFFGYQEYKVQDRNKLQGGKLQVSESSQDARKKTPEPAPAPKPKTPEPVPKTPDLKRPETPKTPTRTRTPELPNIVAPITKPEPPKSQSPAKTLDPPKIPDFPKIPDVPKIPPAPKTPQQPPPPPPPPPAPSQQKPLKSTSPSPMPSSPLKASSTKEPTLVEAPEFPGYKISTEDPLKKATATMISSRPLLIPTPEPSDDEEALADLEEEEEQIDEQDVIEELDEEEEEEFFRKPNTRMVDSAVLEKLESGFKKLEASDSKSLLKKYLTRELFDKLKNLKTPTFGSTLLDVIQSGLENHDSGVGIYAPDAEAYTIFAELFDPIIEDYHGGFKKTDKHPNKDWGDVDSLGNLDPTGEFIISTRVRCGRSLEGYPFNPCLTEAQYKEMEEKVSATLSGFTGELKGTYYPLTGMSKETQQKLIDDHFLFKEGDRFLQAANACRFWPTGRGIFHNENKTFLVWCNEEDHLRIISMQMGGDLGQVYRRLVCAVNDIEKRVPFSHHDRLGFLTFCPTNLGTTVRASVHIKVPKLAANKAKLEEVAAKFNLQVRGTRGEHTEAEGGVYDISNKRRMGLTEYEAVKEMNDGIAEIIKIEREM